MKNPNIDLRSETVREILTAIPHWTIRYGNIIILLIALLLFSFSATVKYPEVISSRFRVENMRSGTASVKGAFFQRMNKGQRVNIRLDAFPETEFGMIRGITGPVSVNEFNGNLNAKIVFTDQKSSSSVKKIILQEGMTGTADLIVGDLTLLQRLFTNLKGSEL